MTPRHRTRHISWLILAALGGVAQLFSVAETPLRVESAHQAPQGTVNVVVFNDSAVAANIKLEEVRSPDEELSLPFWWSYAQENPLAPGKRTRLIVSMTRPLPGNTELQLRLKVNQEETVLELAPREHIPFLRYAVQDMKSGKIYLYLANPGAHPLVVTAQTLNGFLVSGGNTAEPVHLAPGKGGMIFGECPELNVPEGGYIPVIHEYTIEGNRFEESAYLFSNTQFMLGMESPQNIAFDCPTHKYGDWMNAGQKLIDAVTQSTNPIPTVHFCRNRLIQGLPAFAQAAPRLMVNPQASNLRRGKPDALAGYFDVIEMARTSVHPGVVTALIENTTIFEGEFGRPRQPGDAPLTESELLLVSLGALAHGAKGLEFRVLKEDGEDYAQRVQYLLIRMELLRPFLSIGEVLPMEGHCTSDAVEVETMICGDKGVLLLVTQKDPAGLIPLPPFEFSFAAPRTLSLGSYTEVTRGAERGVLTASADNIYQLPIHMQSSSAAYLCVPRQ